MKNMRSFARTACTAALALALVLGIALPAAAALDLDSAKQQGVVGEKMDGYVGIVTKSPSPEVRELVESVNAKRRAAYQEIARKNGTAVEAVGALAGQKLIDRAPAGQWIGNGGHWYRKE